MVRPGTGHLPAGLGGSLGARIFSQVVPAAIARLPAELRARINLTQQARADDVDAVRQAYADMGVKAAWNLF